MQDSFSLKFYLYDLAGYNKIISESIRSHFIHSNLISEYILKLFNILTQIGNFKLFPIEFGLLLLILFTLLRQDRKKAMQQGIPYAKCIMLLLVNLVISAIIISSIKELLHYPRPYCLPGFDTTHMLFISKSCFNTFPSGHTALVSVFVISIWGILNRELKIAGIALILLIGTSRVILGQHFVSDVLYSYAIALFIINPIGKYIVARYFYKLESLSKSLIKKII